MSILNDANINSNYFGNILDMQKTYWGLQKEKWREGIDGCFHQFGAKVFDTGAHKGLIEPGFINNWWKGAAYLSTHLGTKLTPNLYLQLHRIVCAHFKGRASGAEIDATLTGKFRGSNDQIWWPINIEKDPSPQALKELSKFNTLLKNKFGIASIAKFARSEKGEGALIYDILSRKMVRKLFIFFLDTFEEDMSKAVTRRGKLTAIGSLFRNIEWLHPVCDGCGRTDVHILNFLLTQHGFHPVILEHPAIADLLGIEEWVDHLEFSLEKWEKLRDSL